MANIFKSPISGEFFEADQFFFYRYPAVDYDFTGNGKTIRLRNFLKRFCFRDTVRNNIAAYSIWIVRDEDTPEVIAHRLYDSAHYYWIILLMNQIFDPHFQWPLSDRDLYRYVEATYGAANVYGHHHYVAGTPVEIEDLPKGMIVDSRYHNKESVTNFQYEFAVNEARRQIKLLKPEYLAEVLNEWDKIKKSKFTKVK